MTIHALRRIPTFLIAAAFATAIAASAAAFSASGTAVPAIGKHADGEQVKAVKVPGASEAMLDTHPYANTLRYQKDLFTLYPQGVVQGSLDYATRLADATLIAVMRLVTHT